MIIILSENYIGRTLPCQLDKDWFSRDPDWGLTPLAHM
jgi:hypothetical protein